MPVWQGVLFGCGGALAAEVYGLFEFRRLTWNGLPSYLKDWWFWAVGLLGVVAAAFVTWGYELSDTQGLTALVAANVGATWPLLIRVTSGKLPEPDQGKVNDP